MPGMLVIPGGLMPGAYGLLRLQTTQISGENFSGENFSHPDKHHDEDAHDNESQSLNAPSSSIEKIAGSAVPREADFVSTPREPAASNLDAVVQTRETTAVQREAVQGLSRKFRKTPNCDLKDMKAPECVLKDIPRVHPVRHVHPAETRVHPSRVRSARVHHPSRIRPIRAYSARAHPTARVHPSAPDSTHYDMQSFAIPVNHRDFQNYRQRNTQQRQQAGSDDLCSENRNDNGADNHENRNNNARDDNNRNEKVDHDKADLEDDKVDLEDDKVDSQEDSTVFEDENQPDFADANECYFCLQGFVQIRSDSGDSGEEERRMTSSSRTVDSENPNAKDSETQIQRGKIIEIQRAKIITTTCCKLRRVHLTCFESYCERQLEAEESRVAEISRRRVVERENSLQRENSERILREGRGGSHHRRSSSRLGASNRVAPIAPSYSSSEVPIPWDGGVAVENIKLADIVKCPHCKQRVQIQFQFHKENTYGAQVFQKEVCSTQVKEALAVREGKQSQQGKQSASQDVQGKQSSFQEQEVQVTRQSASQEEAQVTRQAQETARQEFFDLIEDRIRKKRLLENPTSLQNRRDDPRLTRGTGSLTSMGATSMGASLTYSSTQISSTQNSRHSRFFLCGARITLDCVIEHSAVVLGYGAPLCMFIFFVGMVLRFMIMKIA